MRPWTLWYLGYPDQALKRSHEALTLAQELSHPFSLAYALGFAASLHQFRREGQLAQEQAEAVITLSTEQGFRSGWRMGLILRGWALAEQGQEEEGIAQIHQGMAAYGPQGQSYGRIILPCWPRRMGKWDRQRRADVLAEALAVVDKTGERVYEAELYRLQGELTAARGKSKVKGQKSKVKSAESPAPNPRPQGRSRSVFSQGHRDCPQAAGEVLELRAATSLARLWQQQGKQARSSQHVSRDLRLVHRRV